MIEKLKSQPRPQNYRHNYFLVLITGLLGCKWHRYKQSTKSNTKGHLIGFATAVFSFLCISFIFYVWNVLYNDIYDIKINLTLEWKISFYILGYVLICISFTYHSIVFLLCLLHIQLGFQLFVHPVHFTIIFINIIGCTGFIILLCVYHPLWWSLLLISLKVVGIFLDIGIMIAITLVCYILIRQFYLTSWKAGKWVCLASVAVVLMCLYFVPICIDCPLVSDSSPPNPGVVALGGASYQAAEYSEVAFQKAISEKVDGIYVTLQYSDDGVPFLYDRESLRDLTDATSTWPNRSSYNPMHFTIKELQDVHIGSWFLRHDPFGNTFHLTKSDVERLELAHILTLSDLLEMLSVSKCPQALFVLPKGVPDSHPQASSWPGQAIHNALTRSAQNISHVKVYYSLKENAVMKLYPFNVSESLDSKPTELGEAAVFLRYDEASKERILKYREKNISVIVGPVNSEWMQSYFRFLEVDYVATHKIKEVASYTDPLWNMTSGQYLAMWITLDCVSVLFIIFCFICLRIRMFGARFSPETISINTGIARQYRCRNMKEKLLREGISTDNLDDTEMQDRGLENNPAFHVSATSGAVLGTDSVVTSSIGNRNNNGMLIL